MKTKILPIWFAFAFVFVCVTLPSGLFAQSDCSEELAMIDERIASGDFPEYNVMMAKQLRDSLPQLCGFLDDDQKAAYVAQIDDLLPTKSKEELRAERRVRSDEKKAIRETRKREEAARPRAPVNAVLQAAPTEPQLVAISSIALTKCFTCGYGIRIHTMASYASCIRQGRTVCRPRVQTGNFMST